MNNKLKNKRFKFIINKSFQFKFIAYTLLPTLSTLCILWISIEYYILKLIEKGQSAGLAENHFYFELVLEQAALIKSIFLAVGIVSTSILLIWAVLISHKIAGPFLRLTNMLNKGDQELKNISFRPGDFFPEVAEAVRTYINSKKEQDKI
jgi:hypothetical protein